MGNEASISGVYDTSPPHPCENLARMEGQSNFLSLLAGIEQADSTTDDAAALGWVRDRCIPEALEAYWGRSMLHRYKLGQLVFDQINSLGKVKDKDRIWVKGAILDALDLFTVGECVQANKRAKHFKVDHGVYRATRKMAKAYFDGIEGSARRPWCHVRLRA